MMTNPFLTRFVTPLLLAGALAPLLTAIPCRAQSGVGGPVGEGEIASYPHVLTPGDRGEWPLTARAGETVIARVSSTAFDPAVEVVDADGKTLAQNDDIRPGDQDALVLVRFAKAGAYRIRVKGYKAGGGGQYLLTVQRFVALEVPAGVRTAGTMVGRTARWVRFHGDAGQTLAVTVRAAAMNPQVEIYQPTGELLDTESAAVGTKRAVRAIVPMAQAGDYYARLTREGGSSGSNGGGDSFAVTVAPARVFTLTPDAAAGAARSLETGGLDLGAFSAKAGDILRISAQAPGAAVAVRLNGVKDAATSDALTELPSDPKQEGEEVALIRRDGMYEVAVSQSLGLPADYTLAVRHTGQPLSSGGAETTGTLPIGGSDYYRIEGTRAEVLRLDGLSEQFDPALELFTAAGERIASDDDGGGSRNSRLTVLLPEAGTYLLHVHAIGDGGAGVYRLRRDTTPLPSLAIGTAAEGHVGPGGVEVWSLTGKAGQTVVLSVRSSEFDTMVRLSGPDGLEVASNDDAGDGTDSLLTCRLPQDGVYTVWVSGKQSGGRYRVRCLDLDR